MERREKQQTSNLLPSIVCFQNLLFQQVYNILCFLVGYRDQMLQEEIFSFIYGLGQPFRTFQQWHIMMSVI